MNFKGASIVKDDVKSVLRSLSTVMFINHVNIINLNRWNANRCYSLQTTYLIIKVFQILFSNSFTDFHSCEVVSSSDMRTKEA